MRATSTPWMPCSPPTWWTTTPSQARCPALPGSSNGWLRPGAASQTCAARSSTSWPRASWSQARHLARYPGGNVCRGCSHRGVCGLRGVPHRPLRGREGRGVVGHRRHLRGAGAARCAPGAWLDVGVVLGGRTRPRQLKARATCRRGSALFGSWRPVSRSGCGCCGGNSRRRRFHCLLINSVLSMHQNVSPPTGLWTRLRVHSTLDRAV